VIVVHTGLISLSSAHTSCME